MYVKMNVLCRLWKPVLQQFSVLKFHQCCKGTSNFSATVKLLVLLI